MSDVVQIGDATLYHGDALEVLPTLAAESVDILWTDPPYGHNNNNGDLIHRWDVRSPTTARRTCVVSLTVCLLKPQGF